ncbi:MAG TPA: ribosome-associated translation inhibitor RaiA [Polyangiaceae bacterium LLY-WYZ-15_(1-7)]|nr:ribosome-associated translation inhibitor RaiA [Polyangiaceae bacterium LLY-WYZ-15_(1-7)]HJL05781.1 ribosome-associated translation inhibitor RaiA [Polyangiaceae bacterium LLY-WYZ-15_(1-7)]HJL11610.1 ribosome-associated translation inhibitor RaiA [Polyangiaceae bacterium LLY-WYZ-15_(1-7)]HJL24280.1 ribosome-associated translation inhibitor RaiA [Polyangiaceae bacterium LLY-WYZ-15_(1-7)]HJL31313.1 ribosome-associated translation inhibitor RaiA [Polyangiaceae bacterium LLY-WYZ-15_(1-7)]
MRISYSFRNVDSSDGLKSYASEKIAKLQKYLRVPLAADVTVSKERHLHVVDIAVHADGDRYAGREESEDMYASVDLCLDKVDRQIRNAKAALVDRKRNGNGSP